MIVDVGVSLRQEAYEAVGHWTSRLLHASAPGRVLVVTSGSFADTERERGRSERRAASEKLDGQVWVEMLRSSRRRPAGQYAFDPMTGDCINGDLAVPAGVPVRPWCNRSFTARPPAPIAEYPVSNVKRPFGRLVVE
jgi:hypothetical protein